jgi:hypothetical protein
MDTSDVVTTWQSLKKHIDGQRDEHRLGLPEVQASLVRRLKELATLGLCDKNVVGWFLSENGRLTISNAAPVKIEGWPAIPLKGLEHIDEAHLTLSVTLAKKRLEEYSIQLRGVRRIEPRTPWYARVDLDKVPKGVGLCSHALIHTHVGTTPETDNVPSNDPQGARKKFSARVPMPWLAPVDALNWLLASVDRRLEPAPNG